MTDKDLLKMLKMRMDGATLRAIGDEIGVSQTTVATHLKKYFQASTVPPEVKIKAEIRDHTEDLDIFEDTITMMKLFVDAVKNAEERDPQIDQAYGNLAHKYIKLIAELRGDIIHKQEVSVKEAPKWTAEDEALFQKIEADHIKAMRGDGSDEDEDDGEV